MFKRKLLSIRDIEDNEDREHRKLRRTKATGRKEIQLSFDDHDEDLVPVLSTRVKQVEAKLKSFKSLILEVDPRSSGDTNPTTQSLSSQYVYDSQEDEPQIVLDDLDQEDSIGSIPNVETLCFELIENYEKRDLHRLFDSVEQNCAFRLFLYAVAYGHHTYWTQNTLFLDVLKKLLPNSMSEGRPSRQKTKAVGLSELTSKKLDELRQTNKIARDHLMRVSMSLQVPNRINQYFQ